MTKITKKRIAVDIEGVLTDSLATWTKEFGKHPTFAGGDHDWDFPDVLEFIADTDLVWAYRPDKMIMLEPDVARILDEIKPFDIVTARANGKEYLELPTAKLEVQGGIRNWLQLHNINCENIVFEGSGWNTIIEKNMSAHTVAGITIHGTSGTHKTNVTLRNLKIKRITTL